MPEKPDWIKNPPPGHFVGTTGCVITKLTTKESAEDAALLGAFQNVCNLPGYPVAAAAFHPQDYKAIDTFFLSEEVCGEGMRSVYSLVRVNRLHCLSGTVLWNEGVKKFVLERLPKTLIQHQIRLRVVAPENPKGRVETLEKGKTYYVYFYEDGKAVSLPKGTKIYVAWGGGHQKYFLPADQPGLTIAIPAEARGEIIHVGIIRGCEDYLFTRSLARSR